MSAILESIQSFTGSTERLVEIQESVNSITRQLTDKHDMKILDWLSPERGRMRHHEVRSRRTPGTGKWVLNTSFFQDWINPESPQRFLWLVGAPGCGKSTLLSLVIDELKLSHTGIAYYYCDYRVQSTNPLTLILGSLLRLFVEQQLGGLPQSLRDLFETSNNESRPPSPSEIESIMRTLTASLPRCFILVDAIDEFSVEDTRQTAQLTRLLDTLAEGGVYVFVTSRTAPTPSLKSSHLVIQHTADEADIKSYVAHTLQDDDSMIDILDTQLQRHISEAIVQHAKGM
ncbi:hypothetical protein BDV25DRAFT_46500 [Aspergillus avenaceus]|uniref:NACHT domain-containing protein n=1 Tax=Aspergillus avenaceus TaxID=36643 RepID=A0A5N6TKS8_ASPAV|nr:hypothetical protein BDV25DRAFT_46500 [Aspergillus avenaceus]